MFVAILTVAHQVKQHVSGLHLDNSYDIMPKPGTTYKLVQQGVNTYSMHTGLDVHIVLVGTKLDLAVHHPHLRQVTQEEVLALAKSRHITHTLETSAKENTNVDACFNAMAQCLMNSETRVRPALSGSNASTEMGTTRPVQSSRCPC